MKKSISKEIRALVWNKYKQRCAYCGSELPYKSMQVDHIEPKFRGYSNDQLAYYGRKKGKCDLSNYNPSCGSCNSSKSTFTLEQWRDEIKKKQHRLIRDSACFRILERFGLAQMNDVPVLFYFEKQCHG